jgi:hypothetical protein
MMVMILFLVGALLALVFARLVRIAAPRLRVELLAAGLIVAGMIYVGFAALAGDPAGLRVELVGLALVLVVVLPAVLTRSPALLTLGWVLHPVWDGAMHTRGLGGYAPAGYVAFCVSFDLVVAVLIATGRVGLPAAVLPRATVVDR